MSSDWSRAASAVATSASACGAAVRRIGRPPAGALLGRRIQIDLHVGVGKDDGADVPSLHHHAARDAQRALAVDQHFAHARHARDCAAAGPSPASGSRA